MLSKELRQFYNSSPMREGVLCWYPFEQSANVLDLSRGALPQLLQNRCAHVFTDETVKNESFDYVVVMDPEDFSVDALKNLRGKLCSRGRLLLAYENPFSLRYWSGKSCPTTGLPYDSLFGRDGRVSKAELRIRLHLAGFGGQKWYYPLTDHWFTREVYSEDYLPNEYMNQRFKPYIAEDKFLQFDERSLYREVVRGGAFEFMCGAYLVEARIYADDAPCTVDYVAVTAHRDTAKRFATVVSNDATARKIPLHADGVKTVHQIHSNHEELASLGVNVVKTRLDGNTLVMPRLDLPTLWDYWADKLSSGCFDENEMFLQYDHIAEEIRKTSKSGKCYWELVPANCFYDERTDKIVFFDQEFFWGDTSSEVAIARAILAFNYSDFYRENPRSCALIEALVSRYDLAQDWEKLSALASRINKEVNGTGDRQISLATQKGLKVISAKDVERTTHKNSIAKEAF